MENLISSIVNKGYLKSSKLTQSFEKIDRKDFILPEYEREKYGDYPLPIGHGQTISQPSTVAFMLELLKLEKGDKVLDLGSGSGWTTALIAEVIGEKGRVYGVEIVPELVDFGNRNLKKYRFKNAEIAQAGEKLGLRNKAPFDKILVSASAESLPRELISQLKKEGRMVVPVRNSMFLVKKDSDGKITTKEHFGFSFVPLIY